MPLTSCLGLNFCQPLELLLLFLQVLCYANSYYLNIFLLEPLPFLLILALTYFYSRAITALYMANNTHQKAHKLTENASYCKTCGHYIIGRDHHCMFTGRCVEKNNYRYFLSYIFYSYLLSFYTLYTVAINYELCWYVHLIGYQDLIPIIFGGISSLYFLIFTGGLMASSVRSIILGIYTVEELKKIKKASLQNSQIRRMYFSSEGRRVLWRDFKANWKIMVGQASLNQLLLVI